MVGRKKFNMKRHHNLCLDDLVSPGDLHGKIDEAIDFTFIHDLAKDVYSQEILGTSYLFTHGNGTPSAKRRCVRTGRYQRQGPGNFFLRFAHVNEGGSGFIATQNIGVRTISHGDYSNKAATAKFSGNKKLARISSMTFISNVAIRH